MASRFSPRAALSGAAILVCSTWLAAVGCDASQFTSPPVSLQSCGTSADNNFPSGNLSFSKPANCPIHLYGSTDLDYAAAVDLPNGSVQWEEVDVTGTTWRNTDASVYNVNPVWSEGSNGRWMVSITGTYTAAAAGFDQNNQGYDDIHNRFTLSSGAATTATVHLTYAYGSPNNDVSTPGAVRPGDAYTASGLTHDWRLNGSLTWTWYVNGQLVATTTDPSTTLYASYTPGGTDAIQVVATDAYGHSATGYSSVSILTACSGNEISC